MKQMVMLKLGFLIPIKTQNGVINAQSNTKYPFLIKILILSAREKYKVDMRWVLFCPLSKYPPKSRMNQRSFFSFSWHLILAWGMLVYERNNSQEAAVRRDPFRLRDPCCIEGKITSLGIDWTGIRYSKAAGWGGLKSESRGIVDVSWGPRNLNKEVACHPSVSGGRGGSDWRRSLACHGRFFFWKWWGPRNWQRLSQARHACHSFSDKQRVFSGFFLCIFMYNWWK